MRSTGNQNCVPEVPADQLMLDRTLKYLRKLRWISKELEAQRILLVLDDIKLQPSLSGDSAQTKPLRLDRLNDQLARFVAKFQVWRHIGSFERVLGG